MAVGGIVFWHPVFQLDMRFQPKLSCTCRTQAHKIRLHGAGDQNTVGLSGDSFAQIIFPYKTLGRLWRAITEIQILKLLEQRRIHTGGHGD